MNYNKLAVLMGLTLTLVLGLLMFGGHKTRAAVGGPICNVPADYGTIQAAVNDPGCSTINVAPGTYGENVVINRQLTLSGSGNTTIIHPIVNGPGITLSAGGTSSTSRTIIEKLMVTGALGGGNAGSGIRINGPGPFGFITFNEITSTANGGNGIAVDITTSINDLIIRGSSLTNNGTDGFRVPASMLSMDGLLITGSHLDNNGLAGWEAYTGLGAGSLRNVTVADTTFDNNANKGMYLERLSNAQFTGIEVNSSGTSGSFAAGIDINLKFASFQDITIQDSTISNSGTGDPINGVGVTVKARSDGSTYGAHPATLVGVNIVNNDITSNQNGIRFGEPLKNNVGPTGVAVHGNNIMHNVNLGIDNQTVPNVDASCNWWGAMDGPGPVGPGSGDKVSVNVTFLPWLLSPSPYGSCGGGLPPKDCHQAVEEKEKNFNDQQKANRKAFDDQQKTAKQAFDSQPHTKQEKKDFDDQQKADRQAFEDQQQAAKKAFQEQYKADEKACKQ